MIESRELFEREIAAAIHYEELALQASSRKEATDLLRLARRRLDDAAKMAVPEPRGEPTDA